MSSPPTLNIVNFRSRMLKMEAADAEREFDVGAECDLAEAAP